MKKVRSLFCVFNNPEYITLKDSSGVEVEKLPSEYNGLTPQEICDKALDIWVSSAKKRYGWVGYCISAKGLHHLHMVLESNNGIDFSSAKKCFPRAHLEITYANKNQVEDYVNKRGIYEEKGEIVVCFASIGEIKGNQGHRSDIDAMQEELLLGKKPSEIMGSDIRRQRFSAFLTSAYLAKREAETPEQRDVLVVWHVGKPGTGKSYEFVKLCKKYGRREVYKIERDLSKGRFDQYEGEKILFLDELKPHCIDWVDLLNALDVYIYHPSARYRNAVSLWSEVHITSVYTPRQFWEETFPPMDRQKEPFEQLDRRIDLVIRHWKDKEGRYRAQREDEFIDSAAAVEDAKLLPFH